jgi:hypothetical protein
MDWIFLDIKNSKFSKKINLVKSVKTCFKKSAKKEKYDWFRTNPLSFFELNLIFSVYL